MMNRWITVYCTLAALFWSLIMTAFLLDGAPVGIAAAFSTGVLAAGSFLAAVAIALMKWAMRGDPQ